MGYLVCFAAIAGLDDATCLNKIPATMPWRAFRLQSCYLVLIEWIRRPNRNNPPPDNMIKFPRAAEFARRPLGSSLPERFGNKAPSLDGLYNTLAADKRAGALPKWAVQSALMLSDITGCRLLSIASDDEEWDLACEVQDGALDRLRFHAGHEDLTITKDGAVLSHPAPDQRIIHRVAQSVATDWCNDLAPIFGFDGDATQLSLVEVARVDFQPERPSLILGIAKSPSVPRPQKDRPFWRFW